MASPLSANDLRLEVRRRFSDPARYALSADSLQSLSRPADIPPAAEAATSTSRQRSPNSLGTAVDSAAKGPRPRWSRVANASRMQLAVEEAEKVADVAGAAAQLMRLSTAIAGEPSPRKTPSQKRAALLADITARGRIRTGLKHVSEQDKARPNADPHATMLADIKGGGETLKSPPKERRGSVNTPPKWMLGVHRMLGVQFGGRSHELLAERSTPLGQVTTASSNSAP